MTIKTETDLITTLAAAGVTLESVAIGRAVQAGISVNLGQTPLGQDTWELLNPAGRGAVITRDEDQNRYHITIDGFEEEEAMFGTVSHMREHPMLSVAIAHAASTIS